MLFTACHGKRRDDESMQLLKPRTPISHSTPTRCALRGNNHVYRGVAPRPYKLLRVG